MGKYIFHQYQSSEYYVDPVFKTKDFTLFGNPYGINDDPDLFEVHIDGMHFSYCLTEPSRFIRNEEFLLKIKRYLFVQEYTSGKKRLINTYFIGDMSKIVDISEGFTNQNPIPVTFEMIDQWYPHLMEDIYKIIIQYILKEQKYLGQHFYFRSINEDVLFIEPTLSDSEKNDYKAYLQKCMVDEGYISIINDGFHIDCFVLTSKAISFAQSSKTEQSRSAFIAIKFDNNGERIGVIQKTIAECGFEPMVMNQIETNNWIMPEIFDRIKKSRFVVVDFSLPCDGAYYEAGYAAALDKPVIHLFDKREENENNKLHFDIAQKSTIFYKDFDDLKERLRNRIIATIK